MQNITFLTVLLAITFVYGVVRLLTFLKVFDTRIVGLFESLLDPNPKVFLGKVLLAFDVWFYYFSLVFQVWYWLFQNPIIK